MVAWKSDDWGFNIDEKGRIIRVEKVGNDLFNMIGVAWLQKDDASRLRHLGKDRNGKTDYEDLLWYDVVNENLDTLDLTGHKIKIGWTKIESTLVSYLQSLYVIVSLYF